MNETYDWKGELELLKSMLKEECSRHKTEVAKINAQAERVIALAGKDAEQTWNDILTDFEEFGKKVNWVKWRYVYIGVGVVAFFLILHYVFGI